VIIPFTVAAAVVPSLLLIWFFHSRDANPEPARVVWATFGLGILTVFPVLLVALPIGVALRGIEDPLVLGLNEAFLTAAVPEEFFKFLVVWLYCSRHREFDEPMDGVIYGALASLGFATFENVLYVAHGGTGVAVMRALTAVPGHAFMGAIMGYFVGQARFAPARRGALMATGLGVAVVLHGVYDFPLLALKAMQDPARRAQADDELAGWLLLLTLAALVFEAVWAVRITRRLRREQQWMLAQRAAIQPATMAAGWAPPPVAAPWPAPPPGWTGVAVVPGLPASAVVMLVVGGLLATVGALFTVASVLVLLGTAPAGQPVEQTVGAVACIGAMGLLPFGGGVVLFAFGLRRLSPSAAPAPYRVG
jgi:hypothetical protein